MMMMLFTGQDASAADSPAAAAAREYAQSAPGTERPYGSETASVASEGKEQKRHFRQSHCHDPEMNAEAEGGKLSSQIKSNEYTAWTCLHKILHDQLLRMLRPAVTPCGAISGSRGRRLQAYRLERSWCLLVLVQ